MCQKAHEQCGTLTAQGKKNALLAWSLELRPCITGRLKPAHWRHVWGGTRPQGTPRYFCHEGHIEKTPSIYKSATALVSEKSHAQPLHSPLSGVLMETNGSATYSGAQCRTVCALETNGRPVCARTRCRSRAWELKLPEDFSRFSKRYPAPLPTQSVSLQTVASSSACGNGSSACGNAAWAPEFMLGGTPVASVVGVVAESGTASTAENEDALDVV